MKYFVAGSTARVAANLVGIHRNTAIRFFHKLREKVALKQQQRSEQFSGEVELDEATLVEFGKVNVVEVPQVKLQCLAY